MRQGNTPNRQIYMAQNFRHGILHNSEVDLWLEQKVSGKVETCHAVYYQKWSSKAIKIQTRPLTSTGAV